MVQSALRAAAAELTRVGYARLRVEDVAVRSGINKTSLYRRWPTKSDLVAATLAFLIPRKEPPETSSLRDDLFSMLRELVDFATSRLGRGIVRVIQSERADPEVDKIARDIRIEKLAAHAHVITRAVRAGELPAHTDVGLVAELIISPVHTSALSHGQGLKDEYLRAVIDTVLAGVRALAAPSR